VRATEQDKCLRFGVFEADIRSGELAKRGKRVRLQEQPFQLLAMLLERPGELLTREELSSKLWPNTIVDFDHGLNKAVAKIREALGDSAENPRFIETVARRGYRFLADVTVTGEGQPQIVPQVSSPGSGTSLPGLADAGTSPRRPTRAWRLLGLGLGLLLVAVLSWSLYPRRPPAPAIRSLAVLPLENLSGDPSQNYFAQGMTDELITRMAQISALRVISRTSVMA
jgi:DNA-binding winged helix-turn-helix (wHTH) protein